MKDLSHYRKSYEKSALEEVSIPDNPIMLFNTWFHETDSADGPEEVNAMTVSTIGIDGFPKSRIVLLKQFTEEGFVFYTNYNSEKGKAIAENPSVCLSFFWQSMERQVIIKGKAEKTPEDVSDLYFASRPLGSRLGAIASSQSEVLHSRKALEDKLAELEREYQDKPVPRPDHWGGYLVRPVEIEFWQGRKNRLHDRIIYKKSGDLWSMSRLYP
ncbi:MAG TPA: pyridoxamine 5'-phosphate oxidase [Flavobacterium sp.]|jgi:pyridoxamine 5'-phosphate oxidase